MKEYSSNEHNLWVEEVREIYNNAKSHTEPYEFDFFGTDLTIFPNVFSPKDFNNTKWYAEKLPGIIKGKSLLEIGTGTGAIAIHCHKNGISTFATEINEDAYKCAEHNFEKHNCNIPVYIGDVYDALPDDFEKVDYIFWNHPYNNSKEKIDDNLFIAGFDYNYDSLRKYIEKANNFMKNPDKGLLLGTGGHADLKTIKDIACGNQYKMTLVDSVIMPLGQYTIMPNDFRIYELTK